MPRTREFDTEKVLDAATAAFWEHGYEGTTLRELMEATGLQKGSIYQAFGDKHSLFVAVLKRYLDRGFVVTREALENATPAEAIPAWFAAMKNNMQCEGNANRGCFAWAAASELAGQDSAVADLLQRHYRRTHQLFEDVFTRGQQENVFRKDTAPADLATYVLTNAAGMIAMSRAGFGDDGTSKDSLFRLILAGLAA
jgi:TetR/AcrR family transcriptional repressor of nem operon